MPWGPQSDVVVPWEATVRGTSAVGDTVSEYSVTGARIRGGSVGGCSQGPVVGKSSKM